MLLGTDAGWGRSGARADTVMVATVDLKTGAVAIFGIPRNTGSVALSGRAAEALGTDVYTDLISSLYFDAQNHPELAVHEGDAGAQVMRDAVSDILGIPIDYYAVVDLNGFIDLVNAFDGVTLNVRERIWVRMASFTKGEDARVYDIQPGIRHLDGWEALAFARSRTGSDDYHRMQRQRCVVLALLYQNGVTDLALRFPDIAGAIKDNLKTDIPIDSLAELIKVRAKVQHRRDGGRWFHAARLRHGEERARLQRPGPGAGPVDGPTGHRRSAGLAGLSPCQQPSRRGESVGLLEGRRLASGAVRVGGAR